MNQSTSPAAAPQAHRSTSPNVPSTHCNEWLADDIATKSIHAKKGTRLLTSPALKRGNACSICRRKKLKCDGIRPNCATCVKMKQPCGYDQTDDKLSVQVISLQKRVDELESQLKEASETVAPVHSIRSASAPRSRSRSESPQLSTSDSVEYQRGSISSFPQPYLPAQADDQGQSSNGTRRRSSSSQNSEEGRYDPRQRMSSFLDQRYSTSHQSSNDVITSSPYVIPCATIASPPAIIAPTSAPSQPRHDWYHRSLPATHAPTRNTYTVLSSFDTPLQQYDHASDSTLADSSLFSYRNQRQYQPHEQLLPARQSQRPVYQSLQAIGTRTPHHLPMDSSLHSSPEDPLPFLPAVPSPSHSTRVLTGYGTTSPHLQSFPFSTCHLSGSISDLLHPVLEEPDGTASSEHGSRPTQPTLSRYVSAPSLHHRNSSCSTSSSFAGTSDSTAASSVYSSSDYCQSQLQPPVAAFPQHYLPPQHSSPFPTSYDLLPVYDVPSLTLLYELGSLYFSSIHVHLPFLSRNRFFQSFSRPATASPSSAALIFAVLAIAAPFHVDERVRMMYAEYYEKARAAVEDACRDLGGAAIARGSGGVKRVLTIEIVQALVLLTLVEMSNGEQQRAFLTISQGVRIAVMLGLHRMDETRIELREGKLGGGVGKTRLVPPSLHPLPLDPVLLEECRRTMCAVLVIDRFEASCVGWSTSLSEGELRLLLPCHDELYANGTCTTEDNALWWPRDDSLDHEDEGSIGKFAWFCRVLWLGGRIQSETYKASGLPSAGPFASTPMDSFLEDTASILAMDRQLDAIRHRLVRRSMASTKELDQQTLASLLIVNCLFLNLHHLRVASGHFATLPFNPPSPSVLILQPGSPEFSFQRCLESLREISSLLATSATYENLHTTVQPRSRSGTFTNLPPYLLYVFAFTAKFAIGEWKVLGTCWSRVQAGKESAEPTAAETTSGGGVSGDEAFGAERDEERVAVVEMCLNALGRMSEVYNVMGEKFMNVIRADKQKLEQRVRSRPSTVANVAPPPASVSLSLRSPPEMLEHHYHSPQQQQRHYY